MINFLVEQNDGSYEMHPGAAHLEAILQAKILSVSTDRPVVVKAEHQDGNYEITLWHGKILCFNNNLVQDIGSDNGTFLVRPEGRDVYVENAMLLASLIEQPVAISVNEKILLITKNTVYSTEVAQPRLMMP